MAYTVKHPKIAYCPICKSDQHVTSVGTVDYFLGCMHTIPKENKPMEQEKK